jgi:subtilase family serine protease
MTTSEKDPELPEKKGDPKKIAIIVLAIVILFLAAALLGVLQRKPAVQIQDQTNTAPAGQENAVANPIVDGTAGGANATQENIATDSTASTSTSTTTTTPGTVEYPDLYVVKYSFSEDPKMGEEFTVNIKIGNKGKADAKSFHWEWYATHAGKDCDGKVDSLAAGKTITVGCKFTYSSWSNYATKVVLDSKSEIYESNESNNEAAENVIPIHDQAKADLSISNYGFNHPPKSGEAFVASFTIKNSGNAATGAFWWEWWPTHASHACRFMIGNLAIGEERTVTCPYTYSSWSTYATKAVADADNNVAESNESNNTYTQNVIPIH